MCIVTCDFKSKTLAHCFAFLTVCVLLFQYVVIRNIQLGHQLYNNCTRLWPTKWYRLFELHKLLFMFCTFSKGKMLCFLLKCCVMQTVNVITLKFSCLHHNILMKFVPYHKGRTALLNDTKKIGLVNWLLSIKIMLRTFQMPLVCCSEPIFMNVQNQLHCHFLPFYGYRSFLQN